MRTATTLLALALAGSGGFVSGRATAPAGEPAFPSAALARELKRELAEQRAQIAALLARPAGSCDPAWLGRELQQLRDALARRPSESTDVAAAPPTPPGGRADELAAAHRLVEEARASASWDDANAEALRHRLALLDADARAEVLAVLVPAINRGEIRVETSGPAY